ncbi:MAG TPA: hypothetical protein VFZ33_16695 [Chitinophagaceae bacterium]
MNIGNYPIPKRKNWIQRLFSRDDMYRPRARTIYDFLTMYVEARHEQRAMRGFIWDITRNNCEGVGRMPSKKIWRRYGIDVGSCNGLAWYLLEKYSEGKITIHEDAQPK